MRTSLYTTLTNTAPEKHPFGLAPEAAVSLAAGQRSPWHSPVPYLFGGLAAMLGLIAFALLILACSYWRLSRHHDNNNSEEGDVEKGDGVSKINGAPIFEDKIVVIMAGNDKPTFLATPALMFSKPTPPPSNDQLNNNKDGANKESTSSVVIDDEKTKEDDQPQHQN